jgi:two-component system, NarL family, nitrate/nitrite response regulator NarL
VVRIRILLVDDHELIRRNIRRLLASQADFEVIAEAATGLEAIRQAEEQQPDLILLDISLPELNGLAALPLIRKVAPAAKVLMVTNHEHADLARASFSAGAKGFLTKSDVAVQLGLAIRQVMANETFLSRSLKAAKEAKSGSSLSNAGA